MVVKGRAKVSPGYLKSGGISEPDSLLETGGGTVINLPVIAIDSLHHHYSAGINSLISTNRLFFHRDCKFTDEEP